MTVHCTNISKHGQASLCLNHSSGYILKCGIAQNVSVVLISFLVFSSFVHFAAGKVDALMRNGVDLVEALNSSSVFLVQAARVSRKHAGKSNASWDLIICAVLEFTCLIL